jgi:hypothetical protein
MRKVFIDYPEKDANGKAIQLPSLSYDEVFASLLFGFTGPRYPDSSSSDEDIVHQDENQFDKREFPTLRDFARYPDFTTDPKFAKYFELAKINSPEFFQDESNLERYWEIKWPCSNFRVDESVCVWQQRPDNIVYSDKKEPPKCKCECGDLDCTGEEVQIIDRWEKHPLYDKDIVYKMFLEKDRDVTKVLETIPLNKIVMTQYRGNQSCCDLCIYKTKEPLEELWVSKNEFEIIFS